VGLLGDAQPLHTDARMALAEERVNKAGLRASLRLGQYGRAHDRGIFEGPARAWRRIERSDGAVDHKRLRGASCDTLDGVTSIR
jgi:hypothetical protein